MAMFHSINLFLTLCCHSRSHRLDVGVLLSIGELKHYILNYKYNLVIRKTTQFWQSHLVPLWLTMIWMYCHSYSIYSASRSNVRHVLVLRILVLKHEVEFGKQLDTTCCKPWNLLNVYLTHHMQ